LHASLAGSCDDHNAAQYHLFPRQIVKPHELSNARS
jgi:hypothetical protein